MLSPIKKNKKGISIMIGYILLITAAIAMSVLVYQWVKTYVPSDKLECSDGVSLSMSNVDCSLSELNLTLKNNGRFDVAGYFIHATNDSSQELATMDLSENLLSGGSKFGGAVIFIAGNDNTFKPNEEITNKFSLSNQIYSVEILPARWEEEKNKLRFVSCGGARIKETINCGGVGDIGNNAELLLHLNGPDDSTNDVDFIDSSWQEHTITQEGNAKLENTQKKFGLTSGYFDGTGDYLTSPASADWNFDGDFTIDMWVYPTASNADFIRSSEDVYGDLDSGDWIFLFDGNRFANFFVAGIASHTSGTNAITLNTWTHIAFTRAGTTWRMFFNGTQVGTGSLSGTLGNTKAIKIGQAVTALDGSFNGYIDELRISKGVARWTENFNAPTEEYP